MKEQYLRRLIICETQLVQSLQYNLTLECMQYLHNVQYTYLLLNIDIGSISDQQFHHFLVTIETG